MIKALSLNIARGIACQLQNDETQVEIYAYGMEILLGTFIKMALLILISALLHILPYTLLVLASFAGFRLPGGGVHLHTYARCLVAGLVLILGLALAAAVLSPGETVVLITMVGAALLAVVTITCWVPAGTDKKQFTDPVIIQGNKVKTEVFALIWFISCLLLMHHKHLDFAFALALGAVASLFFITPWGYFFMSRLDQLLAGKGEEVQNP